MSAAAAALSPDPGHPDHITPGNPHIAFTDSNFIFPDTRIQLNRQHQTDPITPTLRTTPRPSDHLTLSST